ncbi:MAG: hypothetical protein QE271_01930 [Bacteriovoracaceae bacterium]|nr:hypothetical protein [Bacteriovoracaceae bacterium]
MKKISYFLSFILFLGMATKSYSEVKGSQPSSSGTSSLNCAYAFATLVENLEQTNYLEQMISEVIVTNNKLKDLLNSPQIMTTQDNELLDTVLKATWKTDSQYGGDANYAANMALLEMDDEGEGKGRAIFEKNYQRDLAEIKNHLKEKMKNDKDNAASKMYLKLQREIQKAKIQLDFEKDEVAKICLRAKKFDQCFHQDLAKFEDHIMESAVARSHEHFEDYLSDNTDLTFMSIFQEKTNNSAETLELLSSKDYRRLSKNCLNKNVKVDPSLMADIKSPLDALLVYASQKSHSGELGAGDAKDHSKQASGDQKLGQGRNHLTYVSRIIF